MKLNLWNNTLRGGAEMATSSIFANIKITDTKKIEAFVDAIEASIADPVPVSSKPKNSALSDPDAIRALWNKRKEKNE